MAKGIITTTMRKNSAPISAPPPTRTASRMSRMRRTVKAVIGMARLAYLFPLGRGRRGERAGGGAGGGGGGGGGGRVGGEGGWTKVGFKPRHANSSLRSEFDLSPKGRGEERL